MAWIILGPREAFEHEHSAPSETILLSGIATLTLAETRISLEPNEAIEVPAHVPHVITNLADEPAIIDCPMHWDRPPSPSD